MESAPGLKLELRPLLRAAAQTLKVSPEKMPALLGDVEAFIRDRLANLMRERGYTAHEVAAVLEVDKAIDRLDLVPAKLDAVREFRKLPEAESLAAANKRIQNILRKSPLPAGAAYAVLQLPEETKLQKSLADVLPLVTARFDAGDFKGSLTAVAQLRSDVDTFFEKVLVNAEDPAVRNSRLKLLNDLLQPMNKVADISKLAAEL
jgi:glycyl-tRNA synthetase beta chain